MGALETSSAEHVNVGTLEYWRAAHWDANCLERWNGGTVERWIDGSWVRWGQTCLEWLYAGTRDHWAAGSLECQCADDQGAVAMVHGPTDSLVRGCQITLDAKSQGWPDQGCDVALARVLGGTSFGIVPVFYVHLH